MRADPAASGRRHRVWSDYWATGALHSCAGSYAGNYEGSIAAFWRGVFSDLATDARVLDLCCGNAPLSMLLVRERGLLAAGGSIDAVDAARIAPAWADALPPDVRARFRAHSGVDARALPFPRESFALCMSQFGVEYAGIDAMREVARVLRPDAQFAAVMHHRDALPVVIAREELLHLAWLSRDAGLLDAAAGMLEPMARAASAEGRSALRGDADANARRSAFNAALREVEERVAGCRYPDALIEARDAVMVALQAAGRAGAEAGALALQRHRRAVEDSELRLADLIEAALDEAAMRALLETLGDASPRCEVLAFERGGIAGWAVRARRRRG